MKFKGSNWLVVSVVVLLVVCTGMIVFYIKNVSSHFSTNSDEWGDFGAYLGSITGALAFAGVLFSLQLSEKRYTKDSERNLFFKLLDLYQRQVDIVTRESGIGVKGFESLVREINIDLELYIVLKVFIKNDSYNKEIDSDLKDAINKIRTVNKLDGATTKETIEGIIENKKLDLIKSHLDYSASERISKQFHLSISDMGAEEYCFAMKYVSDLIYDKYGYMLGQYYRTVYYMLQTISGFQDEKLYSKTFRSQISRYELSLLLYNAVSSQSNKNVISLYENNDIFNNLILKDVSKANGISNKTEKEEKIAKQKFINELFEASKNEHSQK